MTAVSAMLLSGGQSSRNPLFSSRAPGGDVVARVTERELDPKDLYVCHQGQVRLLVDQIERQVGVVGKTEM